MEYVTLGITKEVYSLSPPWLVLPEFSDSGLLFPHLGHSFFRCPFLLQYGCSAPVGTCPPPNLVSWCIQVGENSSGLPPSASLDEWGGSPRAGGAMGTLTMFAAAILTFLVLSLSFFYLQQPNSLSFGPWLYFLLILHLYYVKSKTYTHKVLYFVPLHWSFTKQLQLQ